MDAMVTARMPAGKKEVGNNLLKGLGVNASQAINALYDYVISEGRLPFSLEGPSGEDDRGRLLQEAAARVDAIPIVRLEGGFAQMDLAQARGERLARQGATRSDAS